MYSDCTDLAARSALQCVAVTYLGNTKYASTLIKDLGV